jgi:hypothetical protein
MSGFDQYQNQDQAGAGGSRPGLVAAAVLRAACSSARMSEAFIARASGVSKDTIWSWADGTCALASVAIWQLERLEAALLTAGAEPALVADLSPAAWCDLVLEAIAADEDTRLLLADPVAGTRAFRELLAWTVAGRIPPRYRHYSPPGPLLADPVAARRAIEVLGLSPDVERRVRGRCANRRRRQRPESFPHCHRRS